MGKSNTQQTSFTAGEVSPILRGRVDVQKVKDGVETCENFIVRPQGPLWKRTGTKFNARAKVHSTPIRLVEFIFSATEAYVLEFGDLYVRVYDNDGEPVFKGFNSQSINSAANNAGKAEVTTAIAHGYTTGDYIKISSASVAYYNGTWAITVTGATTFILDDSVFTGTFTASSDRQFTVVTPYPDEILNELGFTQSADTLFITHKLYAPRILTRAIISPNPGITWQIETFTTVDGPYLDYNKDDITLTVSSIVDSATLKGNAAFVAAVPFTSPADVNDYIEFFEDDWFLAKITAVVSTSLATVDIVDNVIGYLDTAIVLHPKSESNVQANAGPLTAGHRMPAARTYFGNSVNGQPATSGRPGMGLQNPKHYNPVGVAKGIPPKDSPTPMRKDGFDPNAKQTPLPAGGPFTSVVSSHGNTFSKSDHGKWIRIAQNAWQQINAFTNDYTVGLAAISHNTKAYTFASGQEVNLVAGSRTITATLTASEDLFSASDVGRHIRMSFGGQWVFAKFTVVSSATSATIQMYDSFPRGSRDAERLANDGRTSLFRMGAWYGVDGVTGNYPAHSTFHEQRLWFSGSPLQPQTLWGSRPQDFNKMSPSEPDGTVTDDNAIDVTLASSKVNSITWLRSAKVLLVGTIGGEWQGRAATSITEPMTPTNIAFTEETNHGSVDNSLPVKVASAVMFLQRSGQKLRELTYNFELDGWASRDLTIASEHIFRKGTKGTMLAYQNEPHGIIWAITSSGDLVGCTYQREQEIIGWHYHRIGGSGIVESIAVVPSSAGTENVVYMSVKRTIDGSTRRYIESFTADHYPTTPTDKNGFFYVDCGVTQTMTGSGSAWAGFLHLKGATIVVLKNGVSQGEKVVNASGEVTISYVNGDVLTGGYAYTSKLKVLPVQGGSMFGSSDMVKKRVHRIFLRVYKSINAKIGRDESSLQLRTFSGTVGSELLATEDIEVNMNTEYGSDGTFHVQVTDPYPLILLSMVVQLQTND